MEFLQNFDFILKHIPRHVNTVTDLLSHRKDLNKGVNSHTHTLLPLSLFFHHILRPNTACKIYLGDNQEKGRQILRELHNSPLAGHPGITNTWALVSQHYEGP
jgi:integrase-like protein